MEILWSERGYFGLVGNTYIYFYPIIFYQRIKVYRFEKKDMGRLRWNNGAGGKYNPNNYYSNYCTG